MNLLRMDGMLEDYQRDNDAFREKLERLNQEARDRWAREHPGPVSHSPLFPMAPPFSPPAPPPPLPTADRWSVATGIPTNQPPLPPPPPPPSYPLPVNAPVATPGAGVDPYLMTKACYQCGGHYETLSLFDASHRSECTRVPDSICAPKPSPLPPDRPPMYPIGGLPNLPDVGTQGIETGIPAAAMPDTSLLAGPAFLGAVPLRPASGLFSAPRFIRPIRMARYNP